MSLIATASTWFEETPEFWRIFGKYFLQRSRRGSNDLIFEEVHGLLKHMLHRSLRHSLDRAQRMSTPYIPTPLWILQLKVHIHESYPEMASRLLVDLAGRPYMQNYIGGVEWFNKRGDPHGLECEWVAHRRHWLGPSDIQHRRRGNGRKEPLNECPTLLYFHGGGFFFGSPETHRLSVAHITQMFDGRALVPKYRLAPQYPFPCALVDALAAYIYLLRPPTSGAKHSPIHPSKIVIGGDSAGGNLALVLLCIIRDLGLPPPAGGLLISPSCDQTHSLPSMMDNAPGDILPQEGPFYAPSALWPPPSAKRVPGATYPSWIAHPSTVPQFPPSDRCHVLPDDSVVADGGPGRFLKTSSQLTLHAANSQLTMPLVSPAWYPSLGGLPPLFINCGDKEIFRDECILTAHRAANPDEYPLPDHLLPKSYAMSRFHYPKTKVQLQVLDNAFHTLPLFYFIKQANVASQHAGAFIRQCISKDQRPPLFHNAPPLWASVAPPTSSGTISPVGPLSDPGYAPGRYFMARERLDSNGVPREMEPEFDIPALTLSPDIWGTIPAAYLSHFLSNFFKHEARSTVEFDRVARERARIVEKVLKDPTASFKPLPPTEHPPPSALVGRNDLPEALHLKKQLLRKWQMQQKASISSHLDG